MPGMTTLCRDVMAELESLGTEQARKTYRRHGAGENVFGVSFAHLERLRKKYRRHPDLAPELWASGNYDARNLAVKIADPAAMEPETLDRWLREAGSGQTDVGVFIGDLASRSPHATDLMRRWIASDEEGVARGGWMLLARLAMTDDDLGDEELLGYLEQIEARIHSAPNLHRDAMNNVVIAVGLRSQSLQTAALAAADRIGKVEVDHGDTACKTPDARAYIEKALAGGRTRWQRKAR